MVLYYGLAKGAREICKKLAMNVSSIMEVLIFYTSVSFVMVLPYVKEALQLDFSYIPYIMLKSFVIFVAWLISSNTLKKLPISIFGIVDLSRMLFTTIFGVVILKEVLTTNQMIGFVLVCFGLLLLKNKKSNGNEVFDSKTNLYIILTIFSCSLNAVSGTLDKILMRDMTSGQLQFWYLFFLLLFYIVYAIFTKAKLSVSTLKNKWIWAMALLFVTADKALFIAHSYPSSKLTLMTLIMQSGVLVTIIGGKFVFKEEGIIYKLFCAAIVVLGIVIGVM